MRRRGARPGRVRPWTASPRPFLTMPLPIARRSMLGASMYGRSGRGVWLGWALVYLSLAVLPKQVSHKGLCQAQGSPKQSNDRFPPKQSKAPDTKSRSAFRAISQQKGMRQKSLQSSTELVVGLDQTPNPDHPARDPKLSQRVKGYGLPVPGKDAWSLSI